MRKPNVFIILICALLLETIADDECSLNDQYSQCAQEDSCRILLNSKIVYSLEKCGDPEANACNEFFQRANGGFPSWSFLNGLDTKLNWHHREALLVSMGSNFTGVENLEHIMRIFSLTCYNERLWLHPIPIPPILEGLENIEALHWPNWTLAVKQEKWQQSDFDWLNALGELRRLGLNNVFFKEHVSLAYNDANKFIVEFDVPDEMKTFEEYRQIQQSIREDFHYDGEQVYENDQLMQKINQLDNRMRHLRRKHLDIADDSIAPKQILTLAQLKSEIPHIEWQKYFSALLKRPIDEHTFKIQLKNPNYFQDLATVLKQTNLKVISFYIFLRFKDFYIGITPMPMRTECDKSFGVHFAFGANYIFYRRFKDEHEKSEKSLKHIFEALKTQFTKKLEQNKYKLNESTLNDLKEKLNKMELRIGTTPLNLSTDFYNDFYRGTNMTTNWPSLLQNVREILRFRVTKQHDQLFKIPTQIDLDFFFAFEDGFEQPIEPFYVPQRNFIVVPQAFLQPPFVIHRAHEIFQYATSGFGIARALMAAFMPDALVYDAAGREGDLELKIWQNEDFINDFICIRGASKNFQQRFSDIPALQLVIETIYDVFDDGHDDVLELQREEVMNKNYNLEDLFFRFFAHYFRGEKGDKPFGFSTDERLDDIVRHIPQFKKLYNCANNTRMCTLW